MYCYIGFYVFCSLIYMQELFTEIKKLNEHLNKLLEKYKNTRQENIVLKEKIKKLEEQIQKDKNHINTTEGKERDFVVGELSKYINEIDELIKILS